MYFKASKIFLLIISMYCIIQNRCLIQFNASHQITHVQNKMQVCPSQIYHLTSTFTISVNVTSVHWIVLAEAILSLRSIIQN